MTSIAKNTKNILFFVAIIFVTYYIIFRNEDMNTIFGIILHSNKIFLLLCILMMIIYFGIESFNIKRLLNHLGEKTTFFKTLKYTLLCFFFNGITPAASGGQPMEAYFMKKDGISLSKATLVLLIQMCSFKIATILIGTISFVINVRNLDAHLISLFALGFLVYLIPLTFILICIFTPKNMEKIVNFFVKIISKIGFKNIDKYKNIITNYFKQYTDSSNYLKQNKIILVQSILIVSIQLIFYYMVTVMVYKAFNLKGVSLITIFTKQALLYIMVSWVPLPGAIGASEAVYLTIFNPIFGENILHSALLLTRGINFYLFILVGMCVLIFTKIFSKKQKR